MATMNAMTFDTCAARRPHAQRHFFGHHYVMQGDLEIARPKGVLCSGV